MIVLTLTLGACDSGRDMPRVAVEDARITLPAVRGRPGAGYFSLDTSRMPERLVSVTSPRAGRVELHSGNMRPILDTSFPPRGSMYFRPGENHAMLFGLDPRLKPGDRVPLTFTFERAPAVTVDAEVEGPGGGAH
jgi:copper(I)-binding protein